MMFVGGLHSFAPFNNYMGPMGTKDDGRKRWVGSKKEADTGAMLESLRKAM